MDKLSWVVYIHQNGEIIEYNIFNNFSVKAAVTSLYSKYKDDREEFFDKLRIELMFLFWRKYEWEITIFNWTPDKDFNYKKVDVFDQIEKNWEAFTEYVWNKLKKDAC